VIRKYLDLKGIKPEYKIMHDKTLTDLNESHSIVTKTMTGCICSSGSEDNKQRQNFGGDVS
jgi:hypothetical protein